ncbi:hypothetical protein PR202_ga03617 [Eleusine coracana subsp. coracana]|uniref:Chalcone/stilbene synthase N-terminal domain-containing protein n=1 Tax=Eleusine coracana subsp. coracana TaxID=191504 RepID=A0AAV5BNU4_ELECO|nr:hypothetical protein PR202_ga03617 [Eleusine coracana subsp. coracana]
MLYKLGCYGGGKVLRVAKDLAENNRGAIALAVYCDINVATFCGPSESTPDSLVSQALFGDGAATVIVGADPDEHAERPLFQMVSARQTILPDSSEGAIEAHLREAGTIIRLQRRGSELNYP